MKIAIASGKGGTGKTSLTASLAAVWPAAVTAIDLDVEAPNLHLFLKPTIFGRQPAQMPIPNIDFARCTHCGDCADICQFKAISALGETLMTWPDMCHGCGACLAICPADAIREDSRELGQIRWGSAGEIAFMEGRLRVGEAMSPPLMRAVMRTFAQRAADMHTDALLDAPPGVSCPAVSAVLAADAVLLVTEPTPFGLHDLALAWEAFSVLNKPMAVVINRAGKDNGSVVSFCEDHQLEILTQIPYSRKLAEAYANGQLLANVSPRFYRCFETLAGKLRALACKANEVAHA